MKFYLLPFETSPISSHADVIQWNCEKSNQSSKIFFDLQYLVSSQLNFRQRKTLTVHLSSLSPLILSCLSVPQSLKHFWSQGLMLLKMLSYLNNINVKW